MNNLIMAGVDAELCKKQQEQMVSTGRTLANLVDGLGDRDDAAVLVRMKREGSDLHTYGKLAAHCQALARGLAARKNGKTRVGLFAEPGFESIAAALGIIRSGSSVVLLDVQLPDRVLRDILADSGTELVFTTGGHAERFESLAPEVELGILDTEKEEETTWKRFFAASGEVPDPDPEDEAALFYTSGTTGPPKGVPLSHKNLMFQLDTVAKTGILREGDTLLLPLPLHHVYPFVIGTLVPLSLGLTIVLPRSLTGPQIIRALGEGDVTVILGVPRLYSAMVSGIRARFQSKGALPGMVFDTLLKLSITLRKRGVRAGRVLFKPLHNTIGPHLNILASGGSPLDPELAWKLEGLGWKVAIGYGLTETSPLLTINPPGSGKVDSIGKAIQGVELRFDPTAVPGDGKEPDSGDDHNYGELLAKGPSVFSGYLNLPEKTEEAFTQGWFRTGDLGRRDHEEYVYITGRVSTLIVTEGGENIQPDQVEEVFQDHPVIREAGVLQKDGKLVALLVPDPAEIRRNETEDIQEAVRRAVTEQSRKLPSYQRIADFAVTRETLPRTRLGKIKRHILEDRYEQAKKGEGVKPAAGPISPDEMSDQDRTLLENSAARQTWDWLAERYPDRRLTPDTSPQLDLGVDSMEWLNLTMELRERVGVEITDEAIGRVETVRDLLEEVMEAAQEETSPITLDEPEQALSDRQKKFLEPQGPVTAFFASGLIRLNKTLMKLLFKLDVQGVENIPEERVVFTPNHVSYLDPFALGAALEKSRFERTYWAGWTGAAFHNPLNTFVSRMAKTIPIDPRKGVFSSLASAAGVLKRDKNLVWFPEGSRSPSGELQPFKTGIGMLLKHYDVLVVPVYIQGTREAMPVGKAIPRLRPVTVTFGEPVRARELEQLGKGEDIQDRIADGLHRRVAALHQE
ncbi:MAG: AMP-binding protein [Desulfovibrionales bacterium]